MELKCYLERTSIKKNIKKKISKKKKKEVLKMGLEPAVACS